MMASIAPFWDGNETWLVMGGVGLLGRVPPRLRHRHAGALSAGDRDAARAGVSRRRLRIPRDRRQQGAVEHGLRRRLDARGLCAGRDPRRPDPRHRGQGRRLCWRHVRLGDAVRVAVRVRSVVRLCAARRDLAGDENQRSGGRPRANASDVAALRGAGLHGRREPVDAAGVSAHSRPLVLAAEFFLSLAGAAVHRARPPSSHGDRCGGTATPCRSSRRSCFFSSAFSAW